MISNKFAAVFTMMGLFLMACSERDNSTDPGANNYSASSENDNSANDGSDFVVDTSYTSASVNVSGRGSVASLDVVIRDFQPGHSDFENFSEESVDHASEITSFGDAGYDATWAGLAAYHVTCGNKVSAAAGYKNGMGIDVNGNPMGTNAYLPSYLQVGYTTDTLMYGGCNTTLTDAYGRSITYRGYSNKTAGAFNSGDNSTCPSGIDWAQPVIFTPGMVQKYLTFDNMATGDFLNGVHIAKAAEECDNSNFAQWFEDVPGVNMRMETTLDIPAVTGQTGYYELNYNYSNGGYFPLDSIDPATSARVGYKTGTESMQWGPQSLSIYCPPYAYEYANAQTDYLGQSTYSLCQLWLGNGGPRNSGAAQAAAGASGALGLQHLRNYNFTMMGFAKFKYHAVNQTTGGEVFDFAGDDDMWIYVDGVLAVDLGGTHLPVPGKVNVKTLADNGHGCAEGPLAATAEADRRCAGGVWKDNSWHYLHFFYADRQTDGSDFYIRTSLADMAAPMFGEPLILYAELVKNSDGSFRTYLVTNTQLSAASVAALLNSGASSTYFPILDIRKTSTGVMDTLAYKVSDFSYVKKVANGYLYTFMGSLCADAACAATVAPVVGDSLAFNYPNETFQITSTSGKTVTSLIWAPVIRLTVK
jgi:fibro-slime domain-containing protein